MLKTLFTGSLLFALLTGCGGSKAKTAGPTGGGGTASSVDCGKLSDHAIAMMSEGASDDDKAKIAADRGAMVSGCEKSPPTQAEYDCAMAATTPDQVAACKPTN